MALDEWKMMLRETQIIANDCSERDAAMCFAWSRMCVVDELTERGRMRDSHLPFEGFMEALVRLSLLKVLPTDKEIEAYGCKDAGHFYMMLRTNDEERYQQMINDVERNPLWGERPRQPVSRCIAHVCAMMMYKIEEQCGGGNTPNGYVSEAEANRWARKLVSA